MKQAQFLRQVALLIAVGAGALLAFSGGLMLMNVRADWALAAGALVCVAAPILGVTLIAHLLMEDPDR
jgi:hypothetical protein